MQFFVDLFHVGANGLITNVKIGRYHFIALSVHQAGEHFFFTRGKLVIRRLLRPYVLMTEFLVMFICLLFFCFALQKSESCMRCAIAELKGKHHSICGGITDDH